MKVLQLGKFYPIRGGVEKVMWDLARGLSSRGTDCDMLCAAFEPRVIEFGPHGRCIAVKAYKKVAATMISPAMIRWVRRHAAEYDIVHVHHPDPMACLALRLSGYKGKVVLQWHSDILSQSGILIKLYRPLQNWLLKRADIIIGTTPKYIAESPDLEGFRHKTDYLPIGIEDKSIEKEPHDTINVISLGRLVEYKGYEHLIAAAEYLPSNYRIRIGGMGPLYEKLKEQIAHLPEGPHATVELAGYVPDDGKAPFFASADLFVLSSIAKTEAFAIVQIEAMRYGIPVVATTIPGSGVDWVNAHGESGLNIKPKDPKALAQAIRAITAEPEAWSLRARQRYLANFTIDKMLDKCTAIYEGLFA